MSFLSNVNYKIIQFTRQDGVNVNLKVNMLSATNLNEDFLVLTMANIKTPIEMKLFFWINLRRFTLNELSFFALNNNLCMQVLDKNNNVLASYGTCATPVRIFNKVFGINFK